MNKKVDPLEYGLTSRDVLIQHEAHGFFLVILRKSRIIMKDGQRIVEKADRIRLVDPKAKVDLKTNAPICSKTRRFLQEADIDVVEV